MYEGEYDEEEMEYGEEMAEDDEDNVSDDDEDIEGMGEIEGLPGDVNVEVIMEDDEDDDDDEEHSEEDDEDSDDMEEVDEHIEIIGNDGAHIHLEDDGEDDWEDEGMSEEEGDEEEEEEDYEGNAQDEEEEHSHGMEHIARGAIGHLVRALGVDDHEGAVEILQRIEDGGMDPDEQMELEGYLEADQDEEGMFLKPLYQSHCVCV
jgi:E3 ubiquitin-protein ligase HUWE1